MLLVWYGIFPQRSSLRRLQGIQVLWICLSPFLSFGWFRRLRLQDFPRRKELWVFAGRGAGRLWKDRKQVTHSSYILVITWYTKHANIPWHPGTSMSHSLDSWIHHITGPLLGSTLGTAICHRRARPRCDDCTAARRNGRSLKNPLLGRPLKLGMAESGWINNIIIWNPSKFLGLSYNRQSCHQSVYCIYQALWGDIHRWIKHDEAIFFHHGRFFDPADMVFWCFWVCPAHILLSTSGMLKVLRLVQNQSWEI